MTMLDGSPMWGPERWTSFNIQAESRIQQERL